MNYSITNKFIFLLLFISGPIFFIIHPIGLLINIILQIIFILTSIKHRDSSIWILYIVSFSYFGVSLFGVKIYDLTMLTCILYLLILKRDFKFDNKISMVFMILTCYMVLNWAYNGYSVIGIIEISRYLLSFLTFYLFFNLNPVFKVITDKIPLIALGNIFQAIILYLYTLKYGLIVSTVPFINIEYYFSFEEARLSGFSSDPNKYLIFFFFLIIIFELLNKMDETKKIESAIEINYSTYLILFIGVILSLSRTGILALMIFFILIALNTLLRKNRIFLKSLTVSFVVFFLFFYLLYKDIFLSLIDKLFLLSMKILGREHTIEINSSVLEDNRYLITQQTLKYIREKVLIGHGPLSGEILLPYPPHNTILNILLDFGLIGLLIYSVILIILIKNIRFEFVIPFLILPIFLFDLDNLRLFFVLLAIYAVKTIKDKKRKMEDGAFWKREMKT